MHNEPSREAEEIGYKIGSFYLEKNCGDFPKTSKEIESLKVRDIKLNNKTVEIYLGRPGLIIGWHGKNLDALKKYLGFEVEIFESFVWDNVLIPYDAVDFLD